MAQIALELELRAFGLDPADWQMDLLALEADQPWNLKWVNRHDETLELYGRYFYGRLFDLEFELNDETQQITKPL